MRVTKVLIMVLVSLFVLEASAFAGAPSPTTEKPIPVEQVTPPPPPPAPEPVKPLVITKHGTWGLGIGGNPMIGYVEKDNYGYPRTEYGFTWCLGFGVTWFSGQPTTEQVKEAVDKVVARNPNVSDKELPSLVRKELGVNSLSYVELGTALLILPINAEMGIEWILNDNTRTRLGIGLPTLISFGINFDF